MHHRWETLTFLHWDYPLDAVQRLLPASLKVEPWEGRAWVGLVPFHMRVRPPLGPAIRGLNTLPETNVRTYVLGPDGQPGVWFFSLDAANLPAVAAARSVYGLPYYLARMTVQAHGSSVRYRSRRLHGRRAGAGHDIAVVPGDVVPAGEVTEFEHYLTARFALWALHLGVLFTSPAEHPPWALRRATVHDLQQDLVQAAGLPAPSGLPLVHYSDGVDVRIGRPRRSLRPKR
jgi:uncharacterized protein YqjF (DUF2071 family)